MEIKRTGQEILDNGFLSWMEAESFYWESNLETVFTIEYLHHDKKVIFTEPETGLIVYGFHADVAEFKNIFSLENFDVVEKIFIEIDEPEKINVEIPLFRVMLNHFIKRYSESYNKLDFDETDETDETSAVEYKKHVEITVKKFFELVSSFEITLNGINFSQEYKLSDYTKGQWEKFENIIDVIVNSYYQPEFCLSNLVKAMLVTCSRPALYSLIVEMEEERSTILKIKLDEKNKPLLQVARWRLFLK